MRCRGCGFWHVQAYHSGSMYKELRPTGDKYAKFLAHAEGISQYLSD
jgi:hypothetical protein